MSRRALLPVLLPAVLVLVAGVAAAAERETSPADQSLSTSAPPGAAFSSAGLSNASTLADSGAGAPIKPRNPRVLFITSKGCPACTRELARLRRKGGDFEALVARGWKIGDTPDNHIQIVDRDAIPELVERLKVREYPTVACVSDGEIVRSFKDGCTTPLDAWTFGWLMKGENERPHAPIPEPVRVASTGSYPLRGNHWSVDGDWNPPRETVVGHLRGPNHGSQIAANWSIEGWSYEELRSLHDDLHEREMAASGGSYAAYSSGYGGGYSSSSSGSSSGFGASRKMLGR
ncbi:MAG: hypothetical protein ACT4QC_16730 [Planctomycetaceae bacterium]